MGKYTRAMDPMCMWSIYVLYIPTSRTQVVTSSTLAGGDSPNLPCLVPQLPPPLGHP